MIEFVPAYDDATRANLATCRCLLSPRALTDDRATTNELQGALQEFPGDRLLVWAHGDHDGPRAQNGQRALTNTLLEAVRPRAAWAWACHTGTRFGQEVAHRGWTWWGYTGAITAPEADLPEELQILARAFAIAIEAFKKTTSPTDASAALVSLRTELVEIEEELDALETVSYVEYAFILHLWDRARVWFPHEPIPFSHPCASLPMFLD